MTNTLSNDEREDMLRFILSPIDPAAWSTEQVIAACNEWLPGCTLTEIVAALRACAREHDQHADRIERQARRPRLVTNL